MNGEDRKRGAMMDGRFQVFEAVHLTSATTQYDQRAGATRCSSKHPPGQDCQKPSSARPTQLNANMLEAIAASDAKVTMVWTDGITDPRCRQHSYFVDQLLCNQGENASRLILKSTVTSSLQPKWSARKNPHLRPPNKSVGGIRRMFGLPVGDAKTRLAASIELGLLILVAIGLFLGLPVRGPAPEAARDFEECVEALPASAPFHQSILPSNDAPDNSMMDCNARFAGRRKPGGGGYSYYDFMQDRTFDIAGPNPTAEERNRIDREYIGFLDIQRQENVSAELAKRQDEQLRADLERAHQPVGRPLILTPKSMSSLAAKGASDRAKSKHCEDNPVACGWSKLSAAVKEAFASSSRTKP
jgi:hypothetical protein